MPEPGASIDPGGVKRHPRALEQNPSGVHDVAELSEPT